MPPRPAEDWVVTWPTLGDLAAAWIEQHCRIPDMWQRGAPFRLTDKQFWIAANHWRVKPNAKWNQKRPPLNRAFVYRRTQIIDAQKTGKGPMAATFIAMHAVGPSEFFGWAEAGDVYDCGDDGNCGCGWSYHYMPGEPKGIRHPSPLIQITAISEDQTDNTYRPLQTMIRIGPLSETLRVRESFIRIVGDVGGDQADRIDVVTSAANSRLGQPITLALQDEVGLWTKSNGMINTAETQRRGAAGMGGRVIETTNAYDPAENSVAQRTHTSDAEDVFRFHDPPPPTLSWKNKRERRRILRHNYQHSPWVSIDSIEAEAMEIGEKDPAQAERFFGNRIVAASDSYFSMLDWAKITQARTVPDGAMISLGFDGSQYDDWTAIRARWLSDDGLHAFTPTFADGKPTWWDPADTDGEVPRAEVQAAIEELFERYDVVRMYADPELWQSEIDEWAAKYDGKKPRIIQWPTNRTKQMAAVLERLKVDISTGGLSHDDDAKVVEHMSNARRVRRPGGVVVGKPAQHQKIDLAVADALAHEAACDARAAGLTTRRSRRMVVMR